MAKTRIIIEGEGVTPFPEQLLRCNYNGSRGVAAWIGLTIRDASEDGGYNFPWQHENYETKKEVGLFPATGDIRVVVEHDGEVKSEFTCPVSVCDEGEEDGWDEEEE